ncbi:type II secretion system F family protein [Candidatus Dojkabacteria bacterium]|uniref:Type II secretion system F family protein n=1 Tax=Candidatus Dojkabacteria bacterium TaxID=2099670 RepID=A0A955L724_9BACT|nr:type II secretion system F family protein [Candidatus Dojkabacteria bacterium]
MPTFKYKASQKDGKIIEGEKAADTRDDLISLLHEQGFMIINVEEKVGFDLSRFSDIQVGGIPLKEKVFFVKQLSAMLKAGLPIVQALEIMLDQARFSSLKTKLTNVYKDVKSGLPMGASFGKHELIFDELQLSLITAGEQSGNLVEIMEQIADDMEKSNEVRNKVRGALIYPVIVILTAIVVIIILVIFMIPAVEDLYIDLGATTEDIPAITRFLVILSDFFTNPFGAIATIIALLALVIGYRSFYASEFGRKVVDRGLIRMPIFGELIAENQVLQMTRLLGLLMRSGIPIIDALKATAKSLGNVHFQEALNYAADRVSKGSPISLPLAKSGVVPIMVVKMIATGEDTGQLDKILEDLSRFYEAEVNEKTSNLTKLMEPLMLLVVGGLVAFLAVAVYLPIYSISQFV